MADTSGKPAGKSSDQAADSAADKKTKPALLPDFTNYVVPSVEVLLISGFGVILLNYALGWGLFARDQSAVASQQRMQAMDQQAATNNQVARSTGPVVQASESGTVTGQTVGQAVTGQSVSQTVNQTVAIAATHRVICSSGDQGLNFRPSPGFSTPLFAIPCGANVAVTGNAVTAQNEIWSPVTYGDRSGWSASKLLQPLGR